MKNIYVLKSGIVYNPTGKKFNLIASPAKKKAFLFTNFIKKMKNI